MSQHEARLRRGISVIVPVYKSERILRALIARLSPVLESLQVRYELILVNDGSPDNSWSVITQLSRQYPWIVGIDLLKNSGQENALLCGLRAARYDVSVMMDDDLQNPPEEIPRLLAKLEEGFDVVYGTPEKEQHGLSRDLASLISKLVMQEAMGIKNARNVTAFKIFRTQLRDAFSGFCSPHVSIDVLLVWGTQNLGSLKVAHDPRLVGKSNFTFRKLVTHSVNLLTGFSVVPLQLASLMGFVFALFGFGTMVYVLVDFFFISGREVKGFAFLASLITIFSGAQLLALGIMGEYLARIHVRSMERQPYTIRRLAGRRSVEDARSRDDEDAEAEVETNPA